MEKNQDKPVIIKSTRIKNNLDNLVDVIYNNFNDLADNPVLMHNRQDIYKLLSSQYFTGLFIFIGNKLIGYLVGEEKMLDDGRYIYYISYIYISEKYRYKKYGSLLMDMIEKYIKEKGNIKYIVLTCNTSNNGLVNFYKKRGYNIDIMLQTHSTHNVFSKRII